MKKVLAIVALIAMAGIANAAIIDVLYNGDLEIHGDDGFGREMPAGWGLYLQNENWGGIPNVGTTTADANTGLASMALDFSTVGADAAFEQNKGQLGADVQLGWYHFGGFVKGTVSADANMGIDLFGPNWGWCWGGGSAIPEGTYAEWTYFGFDFEITDATANYKVRVKSPTGNNFLVDDFQLTTDVVPEPATLGLLGLAGGALLIIRRKFKV